MTTGFLLSDAARRHDSGPGHPERASRVDAVTGRLKATGLWTQLDRRAPGPAPREALARVHAESHLAAVEAACREGPQALDPDTTVGPGSWEAALDAAGAALAAVDGVLEGTFENAFALCRPPGHHAERDRAMGFCLFNNAAIAAAHARAQRGLERVAIVDWDVHHGNGTQHAFEADPSVLYTSLHQYPHYPGTGAAAERGVGPGLGATLNCPLPAGSGDPEWMAALERRILPALTDFAPELVIVSAGFDAHAADPLSGTRVSTRGFELMTEAVRALAREACGGRLVLLLEGGYDLDALGDSVAASLGALGE